MDKKETNRCPHCGETHPDFKVNTTHEVRTYDGSKSARVTAIAMCNGIGCSVKRKNIQRRKEYNIPEVVIPSRKLNKQHLLQRVYKAKFLAAPSVYMFQTKLLLLF